MPISTSEHFPGCFTGSPTVFDLDTALLTLKASCTETAVVFGGDGCSFNASSGCVCDINSLWFAHFIIPNWKLDLQAAQHAALHVSRRCRFPFLVMFNRWKTEKKQTNKESRRSYKVARLRSGNSIKWDPTLHKDFSCAEIKYSDVLMKTVEYGCNSKTNAAAFPTRFYHLRLFFLFSIYEDFSYLPSSTVSSRQQGNSHLGQLKSTRLSPEA